MGYTSYKTKTNKTKTQHRKQRVNLVLTIQRNWLHGIHNTRRRQTKQKHNIQDEDKQNEKTQHRKQRVNLVLTIQRNWLHGIHKLQDEDKQNKNTTQKTESQSSIDNTEKLATWDTQVTRRRQTKQKHNIENRESIQY